jgi:hypothetical protein
LATGCIIFASGGQVPHAMGLTFSLLNVMIMVLEVEKWITF